MSSVEELFRDVETAIAASDYARIVATSERILEQSPQDADAHKCRIRALIGLAQIDDALAALRTAPPAVQSALAFENAYALYSAGQFNAAASALASINNNNVHVTALRAQVAYAMANFAQAEQLYAELLRAPGALDVAEVRANWLAARAQLGGGGLSDGDADDANATASTTYEQLFNVACAHVAARRFDAAEALLVRANAQCEADLGSSDAELLLAELAPLQVQLAYVRQMRLSRAAAANDAAIAAAYQDALARLPHTSAVHTVAANNFEALRDASDVFQAQRHLKQAANARLLPAQLAAVAMNRAQLALRTNHKDTVAPILAQLDEAAAALSPAARAPLAEAAALIRAALDEKDDSLLEQFLKQNASSARVRVLVAQRALAAGDKARCIAALQATPDLAQHPALVGAAFALMSDAGKSSDELFAWLAQLAGERAAPRELLVGVGRALLKHERAADAAKLFDVLVTRNKRDAEAVALLIEACATCDPARAAELSTRLPALPPAVGFDIELELADSADATRLNVVAAQLSGEAVAVDPAAAAAAKADAERLAKKRAHRRKYRKTMFPKDFDPANPGKSKPADPERWIPKHLRKKAKAKNRGAQGGGKTEEAATGKAQIFDAHAAPMAAPAKRGRGGKKRR
jgi:hypothetical protein